MIVKAALRQHYDRRSHARILDETDPCCGDMEKAIGGTWNFASVESSELEETPLGQLVTDVHFAFVFEHGHIEPSYCPFCGEEVAVELVEVEEPAIPECHYCSAAAVEQVRHRVPDDEASLSEKGIVRTTTVTVPGRSPTDEHEDTVVVTRFACEEHVDEHEVVE